MVTILCLTAPLAHGFNVVREGADIQESLADRTFGPVDQKLQEIATEWHTGGKSTETERVFGMEARRDKLRRAGKGLATAVSAASFGYDCASEMLAEEKRICSRTAARKAVEVGIEGGERALAKGVEWATGTKSVSRAAYKGIGKLANRMGAKTLSRAALKAVPKLTGPVGAALASWDVGRTTGKLISDSIVSPWMARSYRRKAEEEERKLAADMEVLRDNPAVAEEYTAQLKSGGQRAADAVLARALAERSRRAATSTSSPKAAPDYSVRRADQDSAWDADWSASNATSGWSAGDWGGSAGDDRHPALGGGRASEADAAANGTADYEDALAALERAEAQERAGGGRASEADVAANGTADYEDALAALERAEAQERAARNRAEREAALERQAAAYQASKARPRAERKAAAASSSSITDPDCSVLQRQCDQVQRAGIARTEQIKAAMTNGSMSTVAKMQAELGKVALDAYNACLSSEIRPHCRRRIEAEIPQWEGFYRAALTQARKLGVSESWRPQGLSGSPPPSGSDHGTSRDRVLGRGVATDCPTGMTCGIQ